MNASQASLKISYKQDSICEVGVDEAGRGPLWGPLTAAAVILPPEDIWTVTYRELMAKIKDSKKISAKKMLGKNYPLNPSMNIKKLNQILND